MNNHTLGINGLT